MSATQIADIFRALSPSDFRILLATELGMSSREYVPVSRIVRYANLLEEEVLKRLPDLQDKRVLISGSSRRLRYAGFRLTFLGYDCLALNALVKRNVVQAIGQQIGLGKESDVYNAMGRRSSRIALKFHRLGRISFRQTRRARRYVADRSHTSWMYQSRMAATREFEAMKRARRAGVPVPRPIDQNRHLIAMGRFEGSELTKMVIIEQPSKTLTNIIINLKRLYSDAHLVHGDLSEYNILITSHGRLAFIDWPQSVTGNDPGAEELLTRDITNVVTFFAKKYRVALPIEMALRFVKGKSRSLPISAR